MATVKHYDVIITGAGIAGLSLARQLLLYSDRKSILLLDKRREIPPRRQKVGESCVQVSGYYFSKVLDLEEHLLTEHFMKYNLRYYWKTAGLENRCFEDYGQAYIRSLSNVASYQLDRNKIEGEMLRLNLESPRFEFRAPVSDLKVSLSEDGGPHSVSFTANGEAIQAEAEWVVDTSGRGKVLAKQMELAQPNPIRHGASWWWVEGLVNIEKLTDCSHREIRLKRDRATTGHLPVWLATNHFCGEGFWFWVIPLQGKTSLGLVYDNTLIDREQIDTLPKLIEWVCREFPLFARDLPHRKILDHGSFKDFSYSCVQTISPARWALSGEAGRFTDPLYSPGGDLISLHNTLITDAILTEDSRELALKARLYERVMKYFYGAYVPSYAVSYDALGDQETMTLKYTWELSVYFSFYVFPFINDFFTNQRFVPLYLGKFSDLGLINSNLHAFISGYYQWKKSALRPLRRAPIFNDFTALGPLCTAESTFYQVGVSVEEAEQVLDAQVINLRELARYIVAHIYSVVLADARVITNRAFIESLNLADFGFDPVRMRDHYEAFAGAPERYVWSFDPCVLDHFHPQRGAWSPREEQFKEVIAGAEEEGVQWMTTPFQELSASTD